MWGEVWWLFQLPLLACASWEAFCMASGGVYLLMWQTDTKEEAPELGMCAPALVV